MDINQVIGANLRVLREQKRLSQKTLAKMLGVTFQQIQKYEKGISRLSAENIHKLQMTFKVPHSYFFHGAAGTVSNDMALMHGDKMALEAFTLIKSLPDRDERRKILAVVRILAS